MVEKGILKIKNNYPIKVKLDSLRESFKFQPFTTTRSLNKITQDEVHEDNFSIHIDCCGNQR